MSRPGQRSKIFISYRRQDSAASVRALATELSYSFGSNATFLDLDSITPGAEFAAEIKSQLAAVEVVLVVIGRGWIDAEDNRGQRRLLDPGDLVRLEIEEALRRSQAPGNRPLVVPVLIDDVEMPDASRLPTSLRPLCQLQSTSLRSSDWRHDIDRLNSTVQSRIEPAPRLPAQPTNLQPARSEVPSASGGALRIGTSLIRLAIVGAVLVGLAYGGYRLFGVIQGELLGGQDVDLSPSSGPPGTEVVVTATGFTPGDEVRFQAFYSRKGAVVEADADGTAVWRVVMEGGFGPNTERISAEGDDRFDEATATFVYTP